MAFSGSIDFETAPGPKPNVNATICTKCGKTIRSSYVTVYGPGYYQDHFCYDCANYRPKVGFISRENSIRRDFGMTDSAPLEALIDLCEEGARYDDAKYLRGLLKRQKDKV